MASSAMAEPCEAKTSTNLRLMWAMQACSARPRRAASRGGWRCGRCRGRRSFPTRNFPPLRLSARAIDPLPEWIDQWLYASREPVYRHAQGFLIPQYFPAQPNRLRPGFTDTAHKAISGKPDVATGKVGRHETGPGRQVRVILRHAGMRAQLATKEKPRHRDGVMVNGGRKYVT